MQPEKTPRERAEDLIRLLVPDWRPTQQQGLWAIRIGIVLGLLVAIGYSYGITLWDWAKLLIVPAVIAAGGLWFNAQQREREQRIANDRAQDEALQAYLDQMSDLLVPNEDRSSLYDEHPPGSLRSLARARTLTVLPRLDSERKTRVVQFLYESDLATRGRPRLILTGADLSGMVLVNANLRRINLVSLNLSEAILSKADSKEAVLADVDLRGATLANADLSSYVTRYEALEAAVLMSSNLSYADLREANLRGANLRGANLRGANLSGANLSKANLRGASLKDTNINNTNISEADLSNGDLRGAKGWTNEQLSAARSFEGATMPDGQILGNDLMPIALRHLGDLGPTLEDWIKNNKARNADGEDE